MKKTLCACMFLGVIKVYAAAYAQKEEKIKVTTYYPSPTGVYQTIRLTPSATPPADARPGQLYYNSTNDVIMYCNKTGNWTPITGGAGDNITQIIIRNAPPASPAAGDIFFDNTTNTIKYYNNAGIWVNMSGQGYWSEGAKYTSGAFWYYPVYLGNRGVQRRVGIGTRTPDAALSVQQSESFSNEKPVIASFTKILNSSSGSPKKNQTLNFALFPNGTSSSYLSNTSVIYTPENPGGSLQLLADDDAHSISFNVGGYNSSATEVMRLRNPGYLETEGSQNPLVGIGNSTAPYTLFVDSNQDNTTPFGFRGRRKGLKTSIGTITPYNDSVWFTYGCYLENNTWKHSWSTSVGYEGAAFVIDPRYGGKWFCYSSSGLSSDQKTVERWNLANNTTLWGPTGILVGSSSRKLKENFTPLRTDEFLAGIDKLDITRWNYKRHDKSITHIGPVAEDFNQIFNLGRNARENVYLIDEAGVSLAGIKALSGRIKAQKLIIKELKSELNYLESQLSRKGGL